MANTATRIPVNASVYEVVRTHPEARASLHAAGVTSDYLDYEIRDAARAVGMPIERLTETVQLPVQP